MTFQDEYELPTSGQSVPLTYDATKKLDEVALLNAIQEEYEKALHDMWLPDEDESLRQPVGLLAHKGIEYIRKRTELEARLRQWLPCRPARQIAQSWPGRWLPELDEKKGQT